MQTPPPNDYVLERLRANQERLWDAVNALDELTVNAAAADYLDALYQVTRHWRRSLTPDAYDSACRTTDEGRVVAGLTWLRGQEAHHIVIPSTAADLVAEYFYAHYQCWIWTATPPTGGDLLRDDYMAHVAGREIWVTAQSVNQFLSTLGA